MPSSVRGPLMSEAKPDDLYRASGCRILTNATVFTLFHDEGATCNVRQFSYGVLFSLILSPVAYLLTS